MEIYLSVEGYYPPYRVSWPDGLPLPALGDDLILGDDADLFTVVGRSSSPVQNQVTIAIRPERDDLKPEWIQAILSEENLI